MCSNTITVQFLGIVLNKIHSHSHRQKLNTLTSAVKEAVWLKQLLIELGRNQEKINIYCDNNSTICLANNPEFHTRTKHIDIRYHYIRETIINDSISVVHVPTEENIADILTKGLDKLKHYKLIEMMGLKKIGKDFV